MRQLNPGLITDATPRMCIQFDDTRSGIFNQVAEYLKRGLPVTLAAHVANVVAGTGLSIQEIKDLIKMAEDHGTTLSLAQHSNSDFEKLRGPYDPLDFTYEDLRDELDPSQIIDVFGARVFSGGYMQSGTPQTLAYCRDHIDMIHGILEEFGYTHAYYLTNDWYYGQAVGVPLLPDTESARSNTAVDTQIYYYGGAELNSYGACHPGLIKNKFWIPAGYALDLGNNCVPRGAYNGTAWVADPRSGASPWVLGVDEGTITQDYTATVQFQIAKRLAHGGSSVLL